MFLSPFFTGEFSREQKQILSPIIGSQTRNYILFLYICGCVFSDQVQDFLDGGEMYHTLGGPGPLEAGMYYVEYTTIGSCSQSHLSARVYNGIVHIQTGFVFNVIS